MVDLLKGQEGQKELAKESSWSKSKSSFKKKINKVNKGAISDQKKKKINIHQYQDLEGLTVTKLQFSLWLAKNKRNFLYIFYGLLFLIAIVTWPLFIYTFGSYLISGMKEDARLLNELGQPISTLHTVVLSQAAKPLKYGHWQSLKIGPGKYDFVMKISNPNQWYAAQFDYYIILNKKIYGRQHGFILPGETKYLAILGQKIKNLSAVRFVISDLTWERINKHIYPDWRAFYQQRVNFTIYDKKFIPAQATILSEKLNLNELSFKIKNNSAYSYWQVNLVILLRDRLNKIIGVNKYRLDNFFSEETREINVTWTGRLKPVKEIEVIPEVNILDKKVYKKVK
jgi:hypothetical protein